MRETNRTSTRTSKSRSGGNRHTVVYAIGVALLCAVVAFLFTWSRGSLMHANRPDVAYVKFGPIRTSNLGYAMSATLALQGSASDAHWMKRHEAELQLQLQHALAEADVRTLHTPQGLAALQRQLKERIDAAFPSSPVQQVLLTDLIYQSQDGY